MSHLARQYAEYELLFVENDEFLRRNLLQREHYRDSGGYWKLKALG